MSLEALAGFVAGKSIALIGGSHSTIDRERALDCDLICSAHNHAHTIDLAPFMVVAGWEMPELYSDTIACMVNIANPRAGEILTECARFNIIAIPYDSSTYKGTNPTGPRFEWCNVFTKELRTQPFTGMFGMKVLLSLPIAELFVTGFTFYANEQKQFPFKVNGHLIDGQVEWFQKQVDCDARIALDDRLAELFPRTSGFQCAHGPMISDDNGYLWRLS